MSIRELRLDEKSKFEQFKIKFLANIAYGYLNSYDKSVTKGLINYNPENSPAIYVLWHGCQWGLALLPTKIRKHLHILISISNDGELISQVCKRMGFSLVRGSKGREGEQATRDILSLVKQGESIALMVDGPKGPRQKVKRGIVKIAKMAQVPVIPLVPYTTSKICINSWDKFQLVYNPFAKVLMVCGDPMLISKDATLAEEKEFRLKLESTLFEVEKQVMSEYKTYWGKKHG